MKKTVTVGDKPYELEVMTFGQGRDIFKPGVDVFESNCAMVAQCLNNADSGTRTVEDVKALPYPVGSALVFACLDLNGLRATATGEAEAAQTTAK
jgi:hypothetical protein